MTSVVLVDDQDLVRAGIRAILARDESIDIVAEAGDGARGVELAARFRPDVVLMDLRMPGVGGLEATRRIRADPRLSETKVVVLTTFHDDADVVEALRAGAAGYLLKDTSAQDIRDAVHAAAAGRNLLSPEITTRVMELVAETPPAPSPHPRLSTLSERELAVLERVGHGDTNQEIAAALYLSPATARTYVSRILTKLDARDRTELAIIAHRSGVV